MSQLKVASIVSSGGPHPPASPNRVWFQAHRPYIASGSTPGIGVVAGYTAELVDSHSAFDLVTGSFTAPVAGLYLFSYNFAAAVSASQEGDLGIIRRNSVTVMDGSIPTHKLIAGAGWSTFQSFAYVLCEVGDVVNVYCAQPSVAHVGMRYGFQGAFLG